MDNPAPLLGLAQPGTHQVDAHRRITGMHDDTPPDLFTAAGIVLDAEPVRPTPKRTRKTRTLTAAERAADVRREGARRLRAPQSPERHTRVGLPRKFASALVLAFPLTRNAGVLAEVIQRLPSGDGEKLDDAYAQEALRLEKQLVRQGLPKNFARRCARDLLHEAYMKRVRETNERQ